MVQKKMFGICEAKNGMEAENSCRPERMGTKAKGKMLKIIQTFEDGRVPAKEENNWRIEGQKEKNHEKGVLETCEQV